MHSISPYLMRSFNPSLPGPISDRYSILDKLGQLDTFDVLEAFVKSRSTDYQDDEAEKQVFRFSDFVFLKDKRIAYGWLDSGIYGFRSNIIDVKTGKVDFKKAQNHADIHRHFIYIFIPVGCNEAIALLHGYRGAGIKTLFYSQFAPYFADVTKLNFQMKPLSYDKALDSWVDGQAKEIRLVKFKGFDDLADEIKNLGHNEQELRLKPPRRSTLGQLKDYFNPQSEQAKAVELLTPFCAQVKTVVELDGKKRVFRVGTSADNSVCEIEAPEDLPLDGGSPTHAGMLKWSHEIVKEFSATMYPGLELSL